MTKKSKPEDDNIDDKSKGRLSEETINYFKRVEQVLLENSFDDDEHKETFLKNVFNQIENEGAQLTRHTLTSKVLEKIIPLLTAIQMKKFFVLLNQDIELVCCDRFASHVVETVCKSVNLHFGKSDTISGFLKFCKQLRELCSSMLRNVYGSHVLSTIIQVLGGVVVPELITKSRSNRESYKKMGKSASQKVDDTPYKLISTEVPTKFKKAFSKFSNAILEDDNFGELLCHRSASPVLQVLLMVSSEVNLKKYNTLCNLVITRSRMFADEPLAEEEDDDTEHRLPVVFKDDVGSHLIEAIIRTANDELYDEIARRCFKAFILTLSLHPVANYLAQTFLRCLRSSQQAEFFVTKLVNFMEDILAAGHMGCIVRLGETIKRLEMVEKQKIFLNTLSRALHIPPDVDKNPFVKLTLCMMTYDVFFEVEEEEKNDDPLPTQTLLSKNNINYHGACLLNTCFMFKKSKMLVNSLELLDPKEHLIIACHPSGCLIYEGFFQSEFIPMKKKCVVVETFLDSLYTLSCDKFGSRVVDSMWKTNDPDIQSKLQSKLRGDKVRLESDLYGRIILYNCGVKQYVNKMKEVELKKAEKKRKAFADILEKKTDDQPVEKKTKKTKNDDRASKYREQLKMLGISINDQVEVKSEEVVSKTKISSMDDKDDLTEIIHAIEATTKSNK